MRGWEWPDPTGPRSYACGKVAEDRETGNRIHCQLRAGHRDVCHWQKVEEDRLRSASWIPDGLVTFIGQERSARFVIGDTP